MTSFVVFRIANDGPLSPVLVHLTSIARALPVASHGLLKVPGPLEPAGQSLRGSALAAALGAGGVVAADADAVPAAAADAGGAADAEAEAPVAVEASSFE